MTLDRPLPPQSSRPDPGDDQPPIRPPGGRLRAGARRIVDPLGLTQRVIKLEADVFEARQLSQRVAELTDLVAELIVPLAQADPERAEALLNRFEGEIGS